MISVPGTFRDGKAQPLEPVEGREGQSVIIVFPEDDDATAVASATEWDELRKLLEECKVDTGIPDLAHEHDHYLYGKPKRGQ